MSPFGVPYPMLSCPYFPRIFAIASSSRSRRWRRLRPPSVKRLVSSWASPAGTRAAAPRRRPLRTGSTRRIGCCRTTRAASGVYGAPVAPDSRHGGGLQPDGDAQQGPGGDASGDLWPVFCPRRTACFPGFRPRPVRITIGESGKRDWQNMVTSRYRRRTRTRRGSTRRGRRGAVRPKGSGAAGGVQDSGAELARGAVQLPPGGRKPGGFSVNLYKMDTENLWKLAKLKNKVDFSVHRISVEKRRVLGLKALYTRLNGKVYFFAQRRKWCSGRRNDLW